MPAKLSEYRLLKLIRLGNALEADGAAVLEREPDLDQLLYLGRGE